MCSPNQNITLIHHLEWWGLEFVMEIKCPRCVSVCVGHWVRQSYSGGWTILKIFNGTFFIYTSCNVCLITFIIYARLRRVISDSVSIDEGRRNCLQTTGWKNKAVTYFRSIDTQGIPPPVKIWSLIHRIQEYSSCLSFWRCFSHWAPAPLRM